MIVLIPLVIQLDCWALMMPLKIWYLKMYHALPGSLIFLYPKLTEITRPHMLDPAANVAAKLSSSTWNWSESPQQLQNHEGQPDRPTTSFGNNHAHHQNRKAINVRVLIHDAVWWSISQNIHTIQVPAVWHFPGVFTSHEPCLSQVCRPPHASLAGGLSLERVNRIAIVMESPPQKKVLLCTIPISGLQMNTWTRLNKHHQASSFRVGCLHINTWSNSQNRGKTVAFVAVYLETFRFTATSNLLQREWFSWCLGALLGGWRNC